MSTYWHFPIQKGANETYAVEFCHIIDTGRKNQWNENKKILLNNCKINVFMRGDFSVVVGDKVFSPIYGDLCFLAPFEMHYGKIPSDTELDYYQFDIGMNAFDTIPDGRKLLEWLTDRDKNKNVFIRPKSADTELLISSCAEVENALDRSNLPLAFAEVIRFLDLLSRIYSENEQPEPTVLSMNISRTVRFIDENFGEQITIADLSKLCGVSESWLSRSFRSEVGVTIHSYLTSRRIRAAVTMLAEKSVSEISYMCGFSDSSHFISQFRKYFGMTPMEYKRRHMGSG